MANLLSLLKLMRPVNALMMGFAVLVGAALAGGLTPASWRGLLLGFATGFLMTASAMALNDYCDREIDAVNQPDRPIPSGEVKPREALALMALLSLLALLLAHITHRRGLNPDNVVIPAITSASDTTATLTLLPALAITRLIASKTP